MNKFKTLSRQFVETKEKELENLSKYRDQIIKNYITIITEKECNKSNTDLLKLKEKAFIRVAKIFSKYNLVEDLFKLYKQIPPLAKYFPQVTTAKIVRLIIECVGRIPDTIDKQIDLCRISKNWADKEKRSFLRQRIECKLAGLYFKKKEFEQALEILQNLTTEVRRLDDKALLVEIFLLESKIQFALMNIPKSKSALIGARGAGETIYVEPLLQGDLDTQSGITFSAEGDYKIAYSYFFEAFETYHSLENKMAPFCLKYMLLCKIMGDNTAEIVQIMSQKNMLAYQFNNEIIAVREIAKAYDNESLHEYESAVKKYHKELVGDLVITKKIEELYESLLERHLLRIIKSYSRVQITQISKLIKLDKKRVEEKLSRMILDGKLKGVLDQGLDCLITFEDFESGKVLEESNTVLKKMEGIVDALFDKAKRLEAQ